jgi:acyl-CoA thioester hydrolase
MFDGATALSGRLHQGVHQYRLRVFYEDTDAGAIVYHANYLRYAERARTECLRLAGIDQTRLRAELGLMFAVRRCTVDYMAPARLDDLLQVDTRLEKVRGASFEAEQTISIVDPDDPDDPDDNEAPLAHLSLTIACVNEAGRPARMPTELRGLLAGAWTS